MAVKTHEAESIDSLAQRRPRPLQPPADPGPVLLGDALALLIPQRHGFRAQTRVLRESLHRQVINPTVPPPAPAPIPAAARDAESTIPVPALPRAPRRTSVRTAG